MALTNAQRTLVRLYMGWQDTHGQFDSRLEQAMNAVDARADLLALFTNLLTDTPPGFLATLASIDAKLAGTHGRMKAVAVGPLKLNPGETQRLCGEGRRCVGRMASILGVAPRHDVFSNALPGDTVPQLGGGGWVGK